jgi:hypothetical protein
VCSRAGLGRRDSAPAGGTGDKPSPVDLNPHLKKVIDAGKKTNKDKVDYPAARSWHRAPQRASRLSRVHRHRGREAPRAAKSPGGGFLNDQVDEVNESLQAGHDWLGGQHDPNNPAKHDAVPKLTALVPPGVQDFLSLVQKISFKAWDVVAGLNYEYAIRLEPIIEDACRQMTATSIKTRALPVFPVLHGRTAEYALPADVEQKIFDKIDNPMKPQTGLLKKVSDFVNSAVDRSPTPSRTASRSSTTRSASTRRSTS